MYWVMIVHVHRVCTFYRHPAPHCPLFTCTHSMHINIRLFGINVDLVKIVNNKMYWVMIVHVHRVCTFFTDIQRLALQKEHYVHKLNAVFADKCQQLPLSQTSPQANPPEQSPHSTLLEAIMETCSSSLHITYPPPLLLIHYPLANLGTMTH